MGKRRAPGTTKGWQDGGDQLAKRGPQAKFECVLHHSRGNW